MALVVWTICFLVRILHLVIGCLRGVLRSMNHLSPVRLYNSRRGDNGPGGHGSFVTWRGDTAATDGREMLPCRRWGSPVFCWGEAVVVERRKMEYQRTKTRRLLHKRTGEGCCNRWVKTICVLVRRYHGNAEEKEATVGGWWPYFP